MVAPANIRHCFRRLIVAGWLFAGIVLGGGTLTADNASASCGDYLLHGPVHLPTPGDNGSLSDEFGGGASSSQRMTDGEPSLMLPTSTHPTLPQPDSPPPHSPCANGHCQSAPPHPPANSPTRTVYVKQPVVIEFFALSNCGPDAIDWLHPADRLRPAGPSVAVELPPPKLAC